MTSLAIAISILLIWPFLATFAVINTAPVKAQPEGENIISSCTSNKTILSPGEDFEVTINFKNINVNDFPIALSYWFSPINVYDRMDAPAATTNPHTFTLKAPDWYFAGLSIHTEDFPEGDSQCAIEVKSSTSMHPPGICSYSFIPKEVTLGDIIEVAVFNTKKGFKYQAVIVTNSLPMSEAVKSESDGELVRFEFEFDPKEPPDEREAQLNVRESGEGQHNSCLPIDTDRIKFSGFVFGKNPCPGNVCDTALGSIPTTTAGFATKILEIATALAGGIALILMVLGAIRVLTSSGDQQKLAAGRDQIVAATAGLLFLIFSVLILKFIGLSILGGLI